MSETDTLAVENQKQQKAELQPLGDEGWERFVEANERRAHAMGISEEDVDRVIHEYRRENARE